MEWQSDIATALCVAQGGWSTTEQREVWAAAHAFIWKVRQQAMDQHLPKCPTCGKRTDGDNGGQHG